MTITWLLAALHLLALGVGLGAVWIRGRALRGKLDLSGVRAVLSADLWWGIAAFVWISTGLLRAFAGFEKGSSYYLHNHMFWGKMLLLAVILLLEIRPMITFMQWRSTVVRNEMPNTERALSLARTSSIQAVLIILMVLAASAMARGFGTVTQGS